MDTFNDINQSEMLKKLRDGRDCPCPMLQHGESFLFSSFFLDARIAFSPKPLPSPIYPRALKIGHLCWTTRCVRITLAQRTDPRSAKGDDGRTLEDKLQAKNERLLRQLCQHVLPSGAPFRNPW
jgi:hypothetical protein